MKPLTIEDFAKRCKPGADMLEEQMHDLRHEEWDLVFQLTERPLLKWVDGKGFFIGIVLPAGDGWGMPLIQWKRRSDAD